VLLIFNLFVSIPLEVLVTEHPAVVNSMLAL
jgi:hypothetical protein